MKKNGKLILSIYDRSANWPRPYIDAGFAVICWDKQVEGCILENFGRLRARVQACLDSGCTLHGILAAPPCTHFAGSGARWWKEKDITRSQDGDTWNDVAYAQAYVLIVLHLVELYRPTFWVVEQPIGRVERLVPEIKLFRRLTFDPFDYGDPYTKRTVLYGRFKTNLPKRPSSVLYDGYIHNMPPTPDRAAKRSVTPMGFARAFFAANN